MRPKHVMDAQPKFGPQRNTSALVFPVPVGLTYGTRMHETFPSTLSIKDSTLEIKKRKGDRNIKPKARKRNALPELNAIARNTIRAPRPNSFKSHK